MAVACHRSASARFLGRGTCSCLEVDAHHDPKAADAALPSSPHVISRSTTTECPRVPGRSGAGPDSELFEDVLDVLSDRVRRDEEPRGDLAVCLASRDPTEHLRLTRRQAVVSIESATDGGTSLHPNQMRSEKLREASAPDPCSSSRCARDRWIASGPARPAATDGERHRSRGAARRSRSTRASDAGGA